MSSIWLPAVAVPAVADGRLPRARRSAAGVRFNDGEIAEAAWFTRAEIREALDQGDWSSSSESRLLLPGSISIAREIIESWAAAD